MVHFFFSVVLLFSAALYAETPTNVDVNTDGNDKRPDIAEGDRLKLQEQFLNNLKASQPVKSAPIAPVAPVTPKVERPMDLTPSRVLDINESNAKKLQDEATSNALFTFVRMVTSMGTIRLKLYKQDAPRTVENFVGLASGSKAYRDLSTGKKFRDTPFYKKMVFHKVHPDLGIQSGCPWGNGKGWPGFTIKNEANDLKFDRPFLIGMSRTQDNPNSMGSQFFITTAKADHLDKTFIVFGEVVEGEDVVKRISQVKRDAMMKPLQPVVLEEVIVE